jgi:hypothetical protein
VPYFGGLVTQVSLNPQYADGLVIGGLPRSRMPLLLGVLALTLGLATIGVLQLRREDQLAVAYVRRDAATRPSAVGA